MQASDWYSLFADQLSHTDTIQWIVLITGVAEVLLARANHVSLYAAGLVSSLLSIYSLYSVQLYAECILGMYYVVMSIYGWWFWVRKKNRPAVKVTFTNRREWLIAICIVAGGWAILYLSLITYTSSNVPAWDSWVTATAWAGTWLLTRRKVENWVLLNVSNIFAIPLLMMKQLPLLAVLTLFLFVVACFGYFDWRTLAVKARSSDDQ